MTKTEALSLARNLIHGPMAAPDKPVPSVEEAVAAIRREVGSCGYTWLTGEAALYILTDGKEGWPT